MSIVSKIPKMSAPKNPHPGGMRGTTTQKKTSRSTIMYKRSKVWNTIFKNLISGQIIRNISTPPHKCHGRFRLRMRISGVPTGHVV